MVDLKNCNKSQLKMEFKRLCNLSNYSPTFGIFDIFTRLPEYLHSDEQVICLNSGTVGMDIWLIVPTTKRLVFLYKNKIFFTKGVNMSSLNYENIISIDLSTGMIGRIITVNSQGLKYQFTRLQPNSVRPLVDSILAAKSKLTQPSPVVSNSPDLLSQLSKLGELKDNGILTEEEFKEQKAKLLS